MTDLPCPVPLEYETLFYAARKVLFLGHAVAACVLVGSSTHHAIRMWGYLRGRYERVALEKTYAKLMAISYVVCFGLGAVLYPTFRYHARAVFLDRYYPWVSNLFDIKENFAAIALVLAISVGLMSFRLDPEKERYAVRIYATMSVVVALVAWIDAISGLLIASYKAV